MRRNRQPLKAALNLIDGLKFDALDWVGAAGEVVSMAAAITRYGTWRSTMAGHASRLRRSGKFREIAERLAARPRFAGRQEARSHCRQSGAGCGRLAERHYA